MAAAAGSSGGERRHLMWVRSRPRPVDGEARPIGCGRQGVTHPSPNPKPCGRSRSRWAHLGAGGSGTEAAHGFHGPVWRGVAISRMKAHADRGCRWACLASAAFEQPHADYAVGATGTTLYICAIRVSCKQESPADIRTLHRAGSSSSVPDTNHPTTEAPGVPCGGRSPGPLFQSR